ncbi:cytosolic 5'-nucleotidase 1A-like isoform X2 [Carassius gibelio]|uniref:cytosolic 5'-nucleotidase 1A-like isoform X2 n=1 Tax=Carassius gibelio TaxID=101364 RepID=UPI002279DD4D|nr:cytosolic 5'-nucleotidase 1A-like isoform X2 [Carassius gibelio]
MAPFTIAVSSCALFRQDNSPGVAFPLIKALKMVNQRLREMDPAVEEPFKIVLIATCNNMDDLKKRIDHYNLKIEIVRLEKPILKHLEEIKPVLFLSTNEQNVREAISAEYGAATMFQRDYHEYRDEVLRVAFDGDGVLFSDESEKVYAEKGLEAFFQNERDNEATPLALGPLSEFFKALEGLQKRHQKIPIRTYLVTSRGSSSPGIRALKTLQKNNLEINEAFFLSGAPKGPVLKAINPHIFFDDQMTHVEGALQNGVICAHVPYGVKNKLE